MHENQAGLLADFSPGIAKTYGAVEYQFIRSSMAAVEAKVTFALKLVRFPHLSALEARLSKALLNDQRFRVHNGQEIFRGSRVWHAEQPVVKANFNRQRV